MRLFCALEAAASISCPRVMMTGSSDTSLGLNTPMCAVCVIITMFHSIAGAVSRVPGLHPGDGRDGDISYLMTKIFEAGRKYLNSISAMYGRDHVPCAWRRRGAGRVKESGVAV